MKKLLIGICLSVLLFGGSFAIVYGWGDTPGVAPVHCISSGELATDSTVFDGDCYVVSVLVITNGTDDARVILKAGGSGGTVQYETTVIGGDNYGGRVWTFPVKFGTNCYADVNGTGASFIVEYLR